MNSWSLQIRDEQESLCQSIYQLTVWMTVSKIMVTYVCEIDKL